jgi:hypothetical protein
LFVVRSFVALADGCEADCAKAGVWPRSRQPNAAKETARLMARSGVTLLV